MRTFPRITLCLSLAVLVVACSPDAEDGGDAAPGDDAGQGLPAPEQDPQTLIELGLNSDTITVGPDSQPVSRGALVGWSAPADTGAAWVVLFRDSTPFNNGKMVFHGKGRKNERFGPIANNVGIESEFKYWVFYPDGQGSFRVKDPKLVIVN